MNWREHRIPILIGVIAVVLALSSSRNDSPIIDEIPHIGAGYSYIAREDMRLNPEHPPLVKDLAGIALRFIGINDTAAFASPFWTTNINDQWQFGRLLLFQSGNDPSRALQAARFPVIIFFILTGLLMFVWLHRLYDQTAAIIGLILFSFSPTVMAHARFVTTDVAAAFGVIVATYFFVNFLRHQSDRGHLRQRPFWFASIAFGIALLCKFSTVLLVPFFLLLAALWGMSHAGHWRDRIVAMAWHIGRTVLVFAVGFIIIVWPVYVYHTWNYPPDRQQSDTRFLLASHGTRWASDLTTSLANKPIIRGAAQYALGVLMVQQRAAGGNTIYFLGDVVNQGGPIYFPLVYLIKEPLAWWGFVLMALVFALYRFNQTHWPHFKIRPWIRDHFDQIAMVIWLLVYWVVSIRSTLNIGVRHIMPTYPFAIMLVAGQVSLLLAWMHRTAHTHHSAKQRYQIIGLTVAVLLGWFVFENVRTYPYYLTYFNQLVGGPSNGYKYVVDSNLDWGQDLKRLTQWVESQNIPRIEVDYFGWADPQTYLGSRTRFSNDAKYLDANDFIQNNSADGWIAVSATFLQNSTGRPEHFDPNRRTYHWLLAYPPTAVIGNSIFVWHITKP